MKRKQQRDVQVPKIKFSDFRDAWIANSREFHVTRPKTLAAALEAAGVPIPRRPRFRKGGARRG